MLLYGKGLAMPGDNPTVPGSLLVQYVQLLRRGVLLQQLRCDFPLGGKDNAVLGKDADGGAGVGNRLESIFDLVEATLGREDGCL